MMSARTDPVAVDMVCARAMGFDWRKIPILLHASRDNVLPLSVSGPDRIEVASNDEGLAGPLEELTPLHRFRPHFGWQGHIELDHATVS